MKIILVTKTYKNSKLLFATELIFLDNPKSSRKFLLAFCHGNQGDANFLAGLEKIHHPWGTLSALS